MTATVSGLPTRDDVDRMTGPVVLEFGAEWCEHCRALHPAVVAAIARHPRVNFIWVEDGKGKPLGRSFGVKLWPTLVLMRDGREMQKLVRPTATDLDAAVATLDTESSLSVPRPPD